jgi:hypothetical protein
MIPSGTFFAQAIEVLSRVAPIAHADPSSVRGFHTGGLPAVNLDGARREKPLRRPRCAGIARPQLRASIAGGLGDDAK